ncbi:hypothetical protein C495_01285 [Natronorubrum sulfidifaciens JCM 14089]|uniref:Uncharacterized protein n=2 Tax=Natronorubrum sulfidifaciens TaxID=388259 RepID=L9WEZ9_9EURY|nr:hypothetical protein C495_01285 [Natronorubrum sulfidifaciens JCM 14089]
MWQSLAISGGFIVAAILLSLLVIDRTLLERFQAAGISVSVARLQTAGAIAFGTIGVVMLVLVVVVGLIGPQMGTFSAAVLLTFVGGRALLTIVTYAVGNPWHALNPWRQIVTVLPTGYASYPAWLGSWPAVGGLLVLVWLEVIAPLTTSPRVLVSVVLVYTIVTIGGALVFTPEDWFRKADPISVLFRLYGAVAPLQRTSDGLEIRYPGARLSDEGVITDRSEVAVILVVLWELTYGGVIATRPGVQIVGTLVDIGLPPQLVYLGLLLVGFVLFWTVYWLAVAYTYSRVEPTRSERSLAIRFGPPLLAIAAGYHFAHYAGFSLSLWPSLIDTMLSPLNPPENPTQYLLTSWFGYVKIASILLGYLLAVWITYAVSLDLCVDRADAIRCQYPFLVVMTVLTLVSVLLISVPPVEPVYVPT